MFKKGREATRTAIEVFAEGEKLGTLYQQFRGRAKGRWAILGHRPLEGFATDDRALGVLLAQDQRRYGTGRRYQLRQNGQWGRAFYADMGEDSWAPRYVDEEE